MNAQERLDAIFNSSEKIEIEDKLSERKKNGENVVCDVCDQEHISVKKFHDLYCNSIVNLCYYCAKQYPNKEEINEPSR